MTVPKLPVLDIQLLIDYVRGNAHELCDPAENADRVSEWLIAVFAEADRGVLRTAVIERARQIEQRRIEQPRETAVNERYGPGTLVHRAGAKHFITGRVMTPTRADWDRRWHELASEDDAVLVRWGYSTSWEYASDLCVLPEEYQP